VAEEKKDLDEADRKLLNSMLEKDRALQLQTLELECAFRGFKMHLAKKYDIQTNLWRLDENGACLRKVEPAPAPVEAAK